ncbi:MAG: 1-(5-phosphoribosyl)-5-[(5-phosphoribosylamino)methylideneamino]imidazole-4-carboxamide isomerase [Proteobacteria bacterium]|nr:1-(5-phosphoribosyl)-5-[(5-phosphoribosylamino)methylideneamino]imidazole-4-carboxamide isomerase [Pseudomonadota bacterium]
MQIIPAIDIKDGKCVRLLQGQFDSITEYDLTPQAAANHFVQAGAKNLHLVDLDGAKQGTLLQFAILSKISQFPGVNVQIGGGVRNMNHLKTLFDAGATRVVIGSLAVLQPKQVMAWIQAFGNEKIVLAFDVRCKQGYPKVVTQAWQNQSDHCLWDLLTFYQGVSLKHVLCTDVERDGTLLGPNITLYEQCCEKFPNMAFQASGGIGKLEDIDVLKELNLFGVIVGKALHDQCFTLQSALERVSLC